LSLRDNLLSRQSHSNIFFVTLERFLRSFPWHALRQVGLCLFERTYSLETPLKSKKRQRKNKRRNTGFFCRYAPFRMTKTRFFVTHFFRSSRMTGKSAKTIKMRFRITGMTPSFFVTLLFSLARITPSFISGSLFV